MGARDSTVEYLDDRRPEAGGSVPAFYLVMQGSTPLHPPARIGLEGVNELVIGRGEERAFETSGAAAKLWLPSEHLSRQHLRVSRLDDGWSVEDLGSTNGTFVDGARASEHVVLGPAALLEAGMCFFALREAHSGDEARSTLLWGPRDRAPAMATLLPELAGDLDRFARAAEGARPLLLLGETGTGKDVLAAEMHRRSGRSGELVAVNCAALAEGTLQAQLFGHERGAFTSSVASAPGFFRAAHEGTLFLDEIGDLSPPAQAALLRALQSGEVQPVGAARPVTVDVRIIAATNRPLAPLVQSERFRADLYARLAGTTITLPPLRERREDLGLLARAVLGDLAPDRVERIAISRAACYALLRHHWPFNIRQLYHALGAALEQAEGDLLDVDDLPEELQRVGSAASRELHGSEVAAALDRHHGNVKAAAQELGISRAEMYRVLARCGIDPKQHRK